PARPFRSREWFDAPGRPDMAALYLERYMNDAFTREELRSGKPIIGISQSGSDLVPCNRVHLKLVDRIKAGIRDAGGIPMEFPMHPIFENCRRPTAALDRNLAYLGLVEILNGYPIDAVVLTTGCDKTTPASIMAAATVDIPAITLNGGPMLDGWHDGEMVGSGTVIWRSRRLLGAGIIDEEEFIRRASDSAPSLGHCNTMGTASTMNSISEALGMSLPGQAMIPAPYRERAHLAYETGKRIVAMAYEDLRPSKILTRSAFLNAIRLNAAIGGSTNAQPHIVAMARHAGIELGKGDWMEHGYDIPLLVNMQPAGAYLSERFHRAGGIPAVIWELIQADKFDGSALTCTGLSQAENVAGREAKDRDVIRPFSKPLKERAGFLVLTGNLFDFAIMKTSVIGDEFRLRYLCRPAHEGVFEARAIVFDGSDDYHARINDPSLNIDKDCILVIRGSGPIGWPGSAEVVNMQPPDALLQEGITSLPTLGDGRQSGTSDSPSILNASPESAAGGGLAWLRTGDVIRIDLNEGRCDALVSEEEIARRRSDDGPSVPPSNTPWEELFREKTGQLSTGGVLEFAVKYRATSDKTPRHNH
ncbi:MAG TPA: IlvD/Edd family dehydratase, partial [Sphingomicrobium sp.]|nr:IlvD/Edd family dehydratase [Sphingomicrobium sp.]